jgi:alpha-1,3-mannosyl-glycoprotein beta-1,2-N-acetylglucosaminyltransferase
MDLTYLKRSLYNKALKHELENAPVVSLSDAKLGRFPGGDESPVRVEYSSVRMFESTARRLGIMDNVKAGVPRCAYHGVVSVRLGPQKRLVHVSLPLNNVDL